MMDTYASLYEYFSDYVVVVVVVDFVVVTLITKQQNLRCQVDYDYD